MSDSAASRTAGVDFLRTIIINDLEKGTNGTRVATRFPPEPNGFLHIGHAKSICLNFGLADEFKGVCHLRFDDTNPVTEDDIYVQSIQEDVKWLGFSWDPHLYFASDYFEQLYDLAERLIEQGQAYVDSLNETAIREYRGTVTTPGRKSPYRDRTVEENLDLFRRMRAGEFPDGAHVLRAKIDMTSPNMLLRDPVLYRIKHAHHHRTGDAWCIYPLYDFAHPLSDAIEGITHSICTLEFDVHRPLYDWLVEATAKWIPRPYQYEFARGNLEYTVMSKRKLRQLVEEGHVAGWDDPRMPTLAGVRRRGVLPESIRKFWKQIGVAKADVRVDPAVLEHRIRDDLNVQAPRVMGVLRPLKVVLTNYPAGETELLEAPYFPHDIGKEGSRKVPFSRILYIEQDDFMEDPAPKFFRLAPGREVRLRYAYIIRCEEVIKDEAGNVVELHCTYDADTRSGGSASDRKVKGTIHWVSAAHAISAEVRLYDRLFTVPHPDGGDADFKDFLNPNSLEMLPDARLEPSIAQDPPETRYQFTRQGYFVRDAVESTSQHLVFNRIVTLRDTWAKIAQKPAPPPAPKSKGPVIPSAPSQRAPDVIRAEALAREPALAERFTRYTETWGLALEDADLLSADLALAAFFEAGVAAHDHPQSVANWVLNEVLRVRKDQPLAALPFDGAAVGKLVGLIDAGTISGTMAKDVFAAMAEHGGDPAEIVAQKGLQQISDSDSIAPLVEKIMADFPDKVAAYRGGKTGLFGFFMGQIMRQTQGKANPQVVQTLVREMLDAD